MFNSQICKFLYCNINSYPKRKLLINNFIEHQKIDCTTFVETKTKEESNTSYKDWSVIQHNGNLIHNKTRGGSLVQARPDLKIGKANPPAINDHLNECIHFTVPFIEDKLHIFLVYIHPNLRIEENIFTKACLYKYSLIIGDFNINNRFKKRQLTNFLQNSNFEQWKTAPTFLMPHNNDSTPDIILHTANISANILSVEETPDLGSDHLGLVLSLDLQKPTLHSEIQKYNFLKTEMNKVNEGMLSYLQQIEHLEINRQQISNFNSRLTSLILENTPKTKYVYHTQKLPPYIICLIKKKRKLYREYREHGEPGLKTELNRFNRNIQELIQQFKTYKWISACENINEKQGKTYWQEIKKLSKYKNRNENKQTIEEDNNRYESSSEKAYIFAKHYKKVYTKNEDNNFDNLHYHNVTQWYETYFEEMPTAEEYNITEEEYFEILHKGKSTAPGHDYISKSMLRKLDQKVHLYVIKLYEFCLRTHNIPAEWKNGTIITIPKHNLDHSKTNNYRPITLLPVLGKNFEKIITNRIQQAIGNQIPRYQFGFKTNHSTIHPLSILTNNIETSKLNKEKSGAIFLDINKAFDSVWHHGLLFKLHKIGCPKYLVFLINSFLSRRKLRVKILNAYSDEFTPEQGLPQGSPLSPILYNIYCSDIYNSQYEDPEHFSHKGYILQFADDTALIAHNKTFHKVAENLQTLTNATCSWFNKWRLKPNPRKTHFILFNHHTSPSSPEINMYQHTLRPENNINYLGITFDNKINFNAHFELKKKKMISRAKHFNSLTYNRKGINIETASRIYKLICRPMIEYGHILFLNCKNQARKKLQVAETSSIRKITKIRHPLNPLHNPPNHLLYQRTGITAVEERLVQLSRRFVQKQENIEIIERYCIRRTPGIRSAHTHPEQTLLEKLQHLANN